jgi:hypothetical protein
MPRRRASASPTRAKSPARTSSPSQAPATKAASDAAWLSLLNPLDPTFLFLFSTFWTVLFVDADPAAKTLSMRIPTLCDVVAHLTDPAMFIAYAELSAFLHCVRSVRTPLTKSESLAMHWHLANGIIIYTVMDGMCGAFGFMPTMFKVGYQGVDRRYLRELVDQPPAGPSQYEASVARTVNTTELFVYSWMSIMAAVGIATRAKWHRTLEVIVLTMAAYGAVLFVVPDYLDGCLNMQPFGIRDCAPPLTPFYGFFVYFGVVINLIWIVVPIGMLYSRVQADLKL